MTVKELIKHLQTLDPETHVFTKGYEGGFEHAVIDYKVVDIALNVNEEWWYGQHEYATNYKVEPKHKIVKGIIL